MINIDYSQKEKSFRLKVGEPFRTSLPENPTTGFRWEIRDIDESKLDIVHDEFVFSEQAAVGDAGTRIFTFRIKIAGEMTLRLELKRAWELEPIDRFKVNIRAT